MPDTGALRANCTWPPSGFRTWNPEPRARGYRKWRKAVTRTIDWPDDDDDDDDDDD